MTTEDVFVSIALVLGGLVVFLGYKLFDTNGRMARLTMDQARQIHERWKNDEFPKALSEAVSREKDKIQSEGQIAAERVRLQFIQWKAEELEKEAAKKIEEAIAAINKENERARALDDERVRLTFLEWKQQETLRIREAAVRQSNAVHRGKTTEHLVPWLINDYYDPREIRFLGSPVDLIVFNGLTTGYVESVDFIEVKTGVKPRLSSNEELVRAAVIGKRVTYNLLHVDFDEENEKILRWKNGPPKPLSTKIMDEELERLMKLRTEAMENLEFTETAKLDELIYESMANGLRRLSDEVALLRHELQHSRHDEKP